MQSYFPCYTHNLWKDEMWVKETIINLLCINLRNITFNFPKFHKKILQQE